MADELLEKLEEFFDADINQYLSEHGGGAEVVDVVGEELIIRLLGECRGCLSMNETVNGVILKKVHAVFPFIKKVTVTDDVSPEVYEMVCSLFTAGKA
ncbi:MAG: NifU family protein [Lachnospiraceae bacterium]|nr:NifU family protein [Lachnospiraceae bacterium]